MAASIKDLARFGREVREETRRVTWPSLKETRMMSLMVFLLESIIAVFLVLTDLLIGFGLSRLVGLNF